MRKLIPALLLVLPTVASANYAECLLEKLPGTANDVAANAIMQVCQTDHPGKFNTIEQGSGRSWFSFRSGAECTAKTAADTRSNRAAQLISLACRRLYDEPEPDWERGLKPYNGPVFPLD